MMQHRRKQLQARAEQLPGALHWYLYGVAIGTAALVAAHIAGLIHLV